MNTGIGENHQRVGCRERYKCSYDPASGTIATPSTYADNLAEYLPRGLIMPADDVANDCRLLASPSTPHCNNAFRGTDWLAGRYRIGRKGIIAMNSQDLGAAQFISVMVP